jgi:aspartyl/asparaginyl beta-hydroxylase (cupin superfamily)
VLSPQDENKCFNIFDGYKHEWRIAQEPLCFDDTFLHSAHNVTTEPCYILIMDILRKFPSPAKNQLNRILVDDASKSNHVKNMVEKCNMSL